MSRPDLASNANLEKVLNQCLQLLKAVEWLYQFKRELDSYSCLEEVLEKEFGWRDGAPWGEKG